MNSLAIATRISGRGSRRVAEALGCVWRERDKRDELFADDREMLHDPQGINVNANQQTKCTFNAAAANDERLTIGDPRQ